MRSQAYCPRPRLDLDPPGPRAGARGLHVVLRRRFLALPRLLPGLSLRDRRWCPVHAVSAGSAAVYFTILLSHVVLAAAIVPLIALTLFRAYRRQFERHARIAKVTFPLWLYVSITGVIIYLMLYQLPQG